VTDLTVDQVVERCRSYWLESGVSTAAAEEMATELRTHLTEASAAGKDIETVTGPDIKEFADEWASAFLGPQVPMSPEPTLAPSLPRTANRAPGWALWAGLLVMVALVVLVAVFAPKNDADDQATWIAIWLIAAGLLAVGEMVTAGFFLLPFAGGAAAAGILALANVAIPFQITVFVVVSIASLWLLQIFARKDVHGELLPVGASRYTGSHALVTQPVSRLAGTGRVMMGTEDWRATTDGADIDAGTEVLVVEVRGSRLVVIPVEK
jgi:membrane protein implicated in regulation of membrane protease activity